MRLDPAVAKGTVRQDDERIGMPRAPATDALESLFDRAKNGDREALEGLIRQEWPRVHRIVHAEVRDRPVADDLTQETFARVLPRLCQLSAEGPLRAYLDQVARNLVRDRWRRRRLSDGSPVLDRPSHEPGPEAQVLVALDGVAVRAALHRLPPHYRSVLRLRLAEGRTSPEVAVALGRSPGAVRQLLHRALEQLRAEYQRVTGEPLPPTGAGGGADD